MASRYDEQPGAVSGISAILGGWMSGKDAKRQRAIEDEQRKREQESSGMQRALQMLAVRKGLGDLGAEQIPEGGNARLVSSDQLMERTLAGKSPMLDASTAEFSLAGVDGPGAITRYRINPDQTTDARAEQRAESASDRLFKRQSTLEGMRGQASVDAASAKATKDEAKVARENQAHYGALKLAFPNHPVSRTTFAGDVDYGKVFSQAMADAGQSAAARTAASTQTAAMDRATAASGRTLGFNQANILRDEVNKQVSKHQEVADMYRKMESGVASGTAQGDISVIYGFMRMQDPTSTVRESEYATAANAGGWSDTMRNMYNRALDGQKLQPKQREGFLKQAGAIIDSQRASVKRINDRYAGLARRAGVDTAQVNFDPYDGITTRIPSSTSAPALPGVAKKYGGGQTPLLSTVRGKP